ncbi:MAG: uracil-DNA glycosylase family protein [Acidimicrobiia bacterium]
MGPDWDVVRPALVRVLAIRNAPRVEGPHPVEFLWAVHDDLPAEAYPAGVAPALTHIRGTAAFPGGTGLVIEADTAGELPPFPSGGVMVIARDLDAEDKYLQRARSGRPHGDPRFPLAYWRSLYRTFERAGLDPRRCFFTNLYVGLRTGSSPSGPFPGRKNPPFVRWCHAFLELQAEYLRPRLVVFLGNDARKAYKVPGGVLTRVRLGAHEGPAVGLAHPSPHHLTARARRYGGFAGPEAEVALLRDAVAQMDEPAAP